MSVQRDIQTYCGTVWTQGFERYANITTVQYTQLEYLKQHHKETYEHSLRVFSLALEHGITFIDNPHAYADLGIVALFHDIGKLAIPCEVLSAPRALTPKERALVNTHPTLGANIGELLNFSPTVCRGILEHHERLDGSGYPSQLSGSQISWLGQIVGVLDVFDAISNNRSYHTGKSKEETLSVMNYTMSSGLDSSVVGELTKCYVK